MQWINGAELHDVASTLAWQVTLTLFHVLWIGMAFTILAAVIDRCLQSESVAHEACKTGPQSANGRYLVSMANLVLVAALLPLCFLVVRWTASQDTESVTVSETAVAVSAANIEVVASDELRTPPPTRPLAAPANVNLSSSGEDTTSEVTAASSLDRVTTAVRQFSPAIALAYMLGVVVMIGRVAAGVCGGGRLKSQAIPVLDEEVLEVLARQARQLSLRVAPAIAYCERVAVPVVAGVVRPVILLPAGMMSGLSPEELSAVLTRELAHVRRFDHVMIVVQRFLEAVLFFHPAAWWLGRRIHELREHACDDIVIQGGIDRVAYAESLLKVAEHRVRDDVQARQLAQLAIDGGHPSKLRRRVERIVQSSDDPGVRLNHSRGTFAVVATASAVAFSFVPSLPDASDSSAVAAQPAAQPAAVEASETASGTSADAKPVSSFDLRLQEPATLQVQEIPLIHLLDTFEQISEIPVTVDLGAFAMRGVDPQARMSLEVDDESLRDLIDQITKEAHLTYSVNDEGIHIPAQTPSLEFRIVPELPDSKASIRVPENWQDTDYRDGTAPGVGTPGDNRFAWFPIRSSKRGRAELPVTRGDGEFQFGLLSDSAHHVLTSDGTWYVSAVNVQKDDFGHHSLRVKLGTAGGLRMQQLSKTCLDQKMALIVDGVIITAPTVRSEIGAEFVVTGNFTENELNEIAVRIREAMLPPDNEFIYQCDVTDEKTGQPIAGAEVLWRVRRTAYKKDEAPVFEQRFTTDEDGRYSAKLPREAFEFAAVSIEFEARHSDYIPRKNVATRLTLPDAPKPKWSDLRHLKLFPGVPVTGRFIEPDGSPAANLAVMVSRTREGPGAGFRGDVVTRTDNEGRFRVITSASWPKRLHWFPDEFVSDSVALKKVTDSPEPITFGDQGIIRLKEGPRLIGRVVDQNGQPLEGIIVQAFTGTRVPIRYATSNADGRFTFNPLPPAEYRVSVADGYLDPLTEEFREPKMTVPFIGTTVTLPKTGKPKPVTIRQAPTDEVIVTALDEDGLPVTGKRFWTGLEPYRDALSEPVLNEPGKYRIMVRRGRAGMVTTNRPYEVATVWHRTATSPGAPGTGMRLGKLKRGRNEVVVRLRRSGTIRLVAKDGDKVIPWDARNLNVYYARANEFEKLGVPYPGFVISVPHQGPEHVIQRVAPDEDVIIDVGMKGGRRKKVTVRVGAGESKTVTIDFAVNEETAAAGPMTKDAWIRIARKSKEVAETELATSMEANRKVPGTVPENELRKLRFAAKFADLQLALALTAPPNPATIKVDYDIEGAEDESKLIIHNTGVSNGEIGTEQQGLSRWTPLRNGSSLSFRGLPAGKYDVARYKLLEIAEVELPGSSGNKSRVQSGVFLNRHSFELKAGETKSIRFVRSTGQRVKGTVTGLDEFKPAKTTVEICSPNASSIDSLDSLDVTVFDAHQCDDGHFETLVLEPGKYSVIVSGYEAMTQEQLFRTSIPQPRYVGITDLVVPEEGKPQPLQVVLKDTKTVSD